MGRALKSFVFEDFAKQYLPNYTRPEVVEFFVDKNQEHAVLTQFKLAYGNAKCKNNEFVLDTLGSILLFAGLSRDDF